MYSMSITKRIRGARNGDLCVFERTQNIFEYAEEKFQSFIN
jgi:hypothetical protein